VLASCPGRLRPHPGSARSIFLQNVITDVRRRLSPTAMLSHMSRKGNLDNSHTRKVSPILRGSAQADGGDGRLGLGSFLVSGR